MVRLLCVLLLLLSLNSCRNGQTRGERAIAEAWTGPATLKLRAEVQPRSKTVAEVKHGEKLDVLQIRRRFVRVRSPGGVVGWTEMRNLLNAEQMQSLRKLAKDTMKLPSQGAATVYESLNVHSEPSRPSTSFYQINEGMKVEVIGHRLVPRDNTPPPPAIRLQQAAPRPRKKKKRAEPAIPPPPRPPAPAVPKNWVALSKSVLPPPEPESEEVIRKKAAQPPPAPLEDWSLIRTNSGHAGWVLTRNLVMAIPDEVAQYSEGARITSYFPLAEVQDGDQTKHHWLWTTARDGGKPYQFDSFRVFIYMLRRHRYETAYIERGIEGYYPVSVERGAVPKFSLILRDADGRLMRQTWVLEGYNTRKIGEEPYNGPAGQVQLPNTQTTGAASPEDEDDEDEQPSILDRLRNALRRES
ncbi:MAG TPA: SH3 domain-containing protein [Bryobacteraceae bacterium]|nr:SH3 domain-containing protein [Bryobacteraceae bacterium]